MDKTLDDLNWEFIEVLNNAAGTHGFALIAIDSYRRTVLPTLPGIGRMFLGTSPPGTAGSFAYQSWPVADLTAYLAEDGQLAITAAGFDAQITALGQDSVSSNSKPDYVGFRQCRPACVHQDGPRGGSGTHHVSTLADDQRGA